jgi:predicted dehydrogenase
MIGAENSHAAALARALNIDRSPAGFSVTHLWGETADLATGTAKAGAIPVIVGDPSEMLGKIDGVIVAHRDGQYHLAAARVFVEAGLPAFVDKPLSTSLNEAHAFLRLRREKHVAVTTMSAIPRQGCMTGIRDKLKTLGPLRELHVTGPGDPHSPYGGIFFYGIHQVDLIVDLLGSAVHSVMATSKEGAFTGDIQYSQGVKVTLGMTGAKTFSITAIGSRGSLHEPIVMDANPYAAMTELMTTMFKTGVEPFDDTRMLTPIAILEALRNAAVTGRPVPFRL